MLNLLASRGLFIGLIVIVVIVVLLCMGLAAMLFFKPFKTKASLEADTVKKELYRRETELVIKLVTEKAEGKEREILLGELRRLRSAEALVDEVIRSEKAERGIVDKPKQNAKRPAARKPAEAKKPVAPSENVEVKNVEEKKEKPAVKKKKDSLEFEPSDD